MAGKVVSMKKDQPATEPTPKPETKPEAKKEAKEDPRTGKKLHLSKAERLELQNLNLRRQNIELQVAQQTAMINAEQEALIKAVNERVSDDIADYSINVDTGECTFDPNAARRNVERKARIAAEKLKAQAEAKSPKKAKTKS